MAERDLPYEGATGLLGPRGRSGEGSIDGRPGTLRRVATTPLPDGTFELELRHQSRDRSYLLRVLDEPRGDPPLVLQLHGRGIDAVKRDGWTRYSALADEAGFVLAMPQPDR